MKYKSELIKIIFASFLLCITISCSQGSVGEGYLRTAIDAKPSSLDPRVGADAYSDKIQALIFDGLFRMGGDMKPVPHLVEAYEELSPTEFVFHIKKGVKFHNGRELTVKDILYTYKSIVDGDLQSPFKADFARIAGMEPIDDYTLKLKLNEPYSPLFTLLVKGIVSEDDAKRLGKDFGANPIGTGPFIMAKFDPEKRIVLKKNPEYWGVPANIDGVEFQVVKDENVRVLKMMKGDLDFIMNGIPPVMIDKVKSGDGLKMVEGTGIVANYLGFNIKDPILKDPRVRSAIAHAINRDELINYRWQGYAEKANSILSPDNWAFDKGLKEIKFDQKLAKSLLDEAGFKDPDGDGPKPRFKLSYKTSTNKFRIDVARTIANQLGQIGIEVDVQPYEWGTFFNDVKSGNYQVYSLSWVGVTEPDIFYAICHSKQFAPDGLNRNFYKNVRIDKLVEDGRRELDPNKRRAIYSEVQRILLNDLPFFPMAYEKNVAIYKDTIDGFNLMPNASYLPFVKVWKR